MHTLLQHLPAVPEAGREQAALAYAGRIAGEADPAQFARQALAVLQAPELAAAFGPASRAEQPIAGIVAGRVISGQVDRLTVLPGRVLVVDYKSSRAPPATPEDTPIMYLRQMAAYRAVLANLFPEHAIECLLVWTDAPAIMKLPPDLLDRHAPGAESPAEMAA